MGEFAKKGKSLLSGFFENYSNICTSYFQEQLTAIQIRSLLQVKDTKTIATEQD